MVSWPGLIFSLPSFAVFQMHLTCSYPYPIMHRMYPAQVQVPRRQVNDHYLLSTGHTARPVGAPLPPMRSKASEPGVEVTCTHAERIQESSTNAYEIEQHVLCLDTLHFDLNYNAKACSASLLGLVNPYLVPSIVFSCPLTFRPLPLAQFTASRVVFSMANREMPYSPCLHSTNENPTD
ncbi:uncharacterized protein EI97DRAFT_304439 [Westerdykella ornata]|uniref:Uncharacterized protein n=1 Tax=Westerdykella ornata TaxID=318751 RepID=A0A6A6JLY8_WESOR|nr:uncharacterized protein EI97DRAFT_304439 [Westerdykella ornata]KAF2276958.1 hypothetical protein EI97DRAFT_304439 [Westerdykella ornata]